MPMINQDLRGEGEGRGHLWDPEGWSFCMGPGGQQAWDPGKNTGVCCHLLLQGNQLYFNTILKIDLSILEKMEK